ncbi:MAG: hypothetical protein M0R03_20595 [Novosphingobium sp.]|nr:hypothetical protein [Novosphingobium sp.]
MKINAQLLSVKKQGNGDATAVFGCAVENVTEILEFLEDVSIKFWIDGAKEESIVGHIYSTSVNASSNSSKSKFTIKCPESENIKTSQLSSLCGREMLINIELA